MLKLISTIALIFTSLTVYADFVQDHDLLSLHYDHAPDRDDGHATVAALAVVRSLGITPHVVSGAYGIHNSDGYQSAAVNVMQATWGSAWLDAHTNWQSAVSNTAVRWHNVLANGGDIWVAEGGQSDFTSDVIRSIRNTNPSIDTNSRIHVVQHSVWNEEMSNQTDLDYSRENSDYVMIADGNGANATADFNEKSDSFVALARASEFGDAWDVAFSYLNPNNKLDFSDTVELLHILDIGIDQIATINDFGAVFLDNTPTPLATSPTPWSDSYSVNGQCYCDTSYDHGLDSISIDTPAGSKSVQQICADITSTFGTGSFENRVYYNTAQCGHEPANNAADEAICPGIPRALGDYTGSRCNQTGATWNLNALYNKREVGQTLVEAVINNPATGDEVITPTIIFSGSASASGNSGFDVVEVAIRRTGANSQWYGFNGGFSNTVVRQATILTNTTTDSTNWSLPVTLPPGNYRLHVVAFDGARNHSGWVRRDFVVAAPDTQSPSASITTLSSAKVPSSTTFTGTASDTGGSGFDVVEVAIRRTGANSQWYDFNGGFSNTAVRQATILTNATTSTTNWSLPVYLPPGNYRLHVVAFDGARNNSGWVRRDFVVE